MSKPARQLRMSLWSLDYMIEDALRFLKDNEPDTGYFVAFSGGKDSIVIEHLCRMAGVKYFVGHSFTGIDPPEIIKFIRKHYPSTTFYHPRMSFWEGVIRWMPPLPVTRWCCKELKKNPTRNVKIPRVVGIRKEESSKRARLPRKQVHTELNQWIYHPILNWTEWHLWEFIEQNSLPYSSLYEEGFSRIGCVVCPFLFRANQGELKARMNRWPKHYRTFEKCVRQWWEREDVKKKVQGFNSVDEFLESYYRGLPEAKAKKVSVEMFLPGTEVAQGG